MITVKDWELISFFEVEPRQLDDSSWPYNDNVYVVERAGLILSFAIAPAYVDVRLILEYEGRKVYDFGAVSVTDVKYRNERGVETLDIVLSENESILLRVKPDIEILHQFNGEKQD